ncbi:hypothetical protein Q3G72_018840 [Acer saccharum]|nr:hypothetical protein Q3G72_018840 [Acer saccharum]
MEMEMEEGEAPEPWAQKFVDKLPQCGKEQTLNSINADSRITFKESYRKNSLMAIAEQVFITLYCEM